jgi:SAM-dependent methyltransferase
MTPRILNLGCGFRKEPGAVNVDAYPICEPDVVWDLNQTPLPFEDGAFDLILARHVLEHLQDWWACFVDCARILAPGGELHIHVPHDSNTATLAYRDHYHLFSVVSFAGTIGHGSATNAWAKTHRNSVPLEMVEFAIVPFNKYRWLSYCPPLLKFVSHHLNNFIWEQRFVFRKRCGPH